MKNQGLGFDKSGVIQREKVVGQASACCSHGINRGLFAGFPSSSPVTNEPEENVAEGAGQKTELLEQDKGPGHHDDHDKRRKSRACL